MLVYIAGNPRVSMNEIKELKAELEKSGHTVTSDWIDNYGNETDRKEAAFNDLSDLSNSHAFVLVDNLEYGSGMYTELGYAFSVCVSIYVLPPYSHNIFLNHYRVQLVKDVEELKAKLEAERWEYEDYEWP